MRIEIPGSQSPALAITFLVNYESQLGMDRFIIGLHVLTTYQLDIHRIVRYQHPEDGDSTSSRQVPTSLHSGQ